MYIVCTFVSVYCVHVRVCILCARSCLCQRPALSACLLGSLESTGAVKAHQRAEYGQASSGKVLSVSFSLLAHARTGSLSLSVCACARACR